MNDPVFNAMLNDGVLKFSFSSLCEDYLSHYGGRAFLTPSCTTALELAVLLSGIEKGDEVILPSFTFSSCANAVIRAGGTPVFVDIRRDTLNIDWLEVERATTEKTKAVIAVHYAGVSPGIIPSDRTNVRIIEDAAQSIGNFTLAGDFACFSFHKSKNVHCGEGGALLVRDPELWDKTDTLRNCGTTCFKEKDWDWVDFGTHGLMNEYTAEVLWQGLKSVERITEERRRIWRIYHDGVRAEEKASVRGNGHIFWLLTEDRDSKMSNLSSRGIRAVKHYTPLHNRKPGLQYGYSYGDCKNSTYVSERILRLPMNVTEQRAFEIVDEINKELS